MELTLNETLFLLLTIVAVVVAVFLVRFLIQLRRTARAAEKAIGELQALERKVSARVDDVGEVLESSKRAVSGISEIALFMATKVVRPASNYWPILYPLLRFGWQRYKKKKER